LYKESLILKFNDISINDVARVGGKNASLDEMFNRLYGVLPLVYWLEPPLCIFLFN